MKLSEKHIVKIIATGPLVFTPLLIIITLFLTINIYNSALQESVDSLEKDLIALEKKAVKARVDSFTELIEYRKSIVEKDLKVRIKQRVYNARSIAQKVYEKYQHSKTDQEIQQIIINTLRPVQWNSEESYLWIINYDGILLLGPKSMRSREGTSILDLKDANERDIIKDEIYIAKKSGEGYLYDTFNKPHTTSQHQQVAFLKDFGHFNWYIGTAEFLDTAAKKQDHEVIESLQNVSRIDDHSMFVLTNKGKILLSQATPQLVGQNLFDFDNTALNKTFKRTLKEMTENAYVFVSYPWRNPKTMQLDTKYTYVRQVKKSDWIIGSGFYATTIKNRVAKRTLIIYDHYYDKFFILLLVGVGALVLGLLFSLLLSRYIRRNFLQYQEKVSQANQALQKLNTALEEKVKERTKTLETMTQELQILATTDSLTKTHNRYSIMKILETEISRAKRSQQVLTVIMVDADHFKDINDNYGHDVGDDVLRHLAHLLQTVLRDIDYLGRYGGEEFIIVLPNTPQNEALHIAERLRNTVSSSCFERTQTLTISLGVVALQENDDLNTLFKRLDSLMYKAKEQGRNNVIGENN